MMYQAWRNWRLTFPYRPGHEARSVEKSAYLLDPPVCGSKVGRHAPRWGIRKNWTVAVLQGARQRIATFARGYVRTSGR